MARTVARNPEIPLWLDVMRAITGLTETPGEADNPKILAMRDAIKRIWRDVPGLPEYADSYQHDDTPWCGLTAAFCVSMAGYMPAYKPPPADDTERFYWAQATASDDHYVELSGPVLGAIMVMTREGGGHISLVESWTEDTVTCRGGNQSDQVNVQTYDRDDVIGFYWPKEAPMPDIPRGTIQKGSRGPDVVACQEILRVYPADGDFGSITDGAVKGFQAACSISQDGVVGPTTWGKLDELDMKAKRGNDGLPPEMVEQIVDLAEASAIANYSWRDRGKAPLGYTAGLALCFALALDRLNAEDEAAWEMAKAKTNDASKDVMAWYAAEFAAAGMDNSEDGADTLRHLFALMLGLGMRESSGRYSEGRDQSASNVTADTAEAGLFQTSWNIRSSDPEIAPLLSQYWANPNGFQPQFKKGVTLKSSDLGGFGSGGGAQYQFLSKYAPAFHALVTALGLRNLRQHWGPINRREVELKTQADQMLSGVQEIVESGVEPPEPEPPPEYENRVDITAPEVDEIVITGDVYVTVNGNPWEPS